MEFNTLVKTQISPLLLKSGFHLVEEFKNILRFQSSTLEVNIVYNSYEKSCYISIGKKGESLYELKDNALKEVFHFLLPVSQTTPDIFVRNVSKFFNTNEGAELLNGNIDSFIKYKTAEDNEYTFELTQKQAISIIDKAWEDRDYIAFINHIDRLGISKLPESYALKYKIARQKLDS